MNRLLEMTTVYTDFFRVFL